MPSLVEISPVVLEKIFKYFQYNFTFLLLSSWRKLLPFKFESPPSKDALCHVWLKLAQWFVESINFTISLLSPLGEGLGPSFEQTLIPSTKGCFVLCLVEIGPVVLEQKLKIKKVYRQADDR